jgi:hypothetical protein
MPALVAPARDAGENICADPLKKLAAREDGEVCVFRHATV